MKLRRLNSLLRPGDYFTVLLGLALVIASAMTLWFGHSRPTTAVVRQEGRIIARLPLTAEKTLTVPGPLGNTLVEVAPGRARVAADPGPRQLCVRQGWLTSPGSVALCLPSRLSLALENGDPSADTLVY